MIEEEIQENYRKGEDKEIMIMLNLKLEKKLSLLIMQNL